MREHASFRQSFRSSSSTDTLVIRRAPSSLARLILDRSLAVALARRPRVSPRVVLTSSSPARATIFIARASRVAHEGVERARRFIFARVVVVVVVVARARARAVAAASEIVIADILGAPARRPLGGARASE